MSKKHFIALADVIKNSPPETFSPKAIELLASFCADQNYNFKWSRWISYIRGECGPNGGTIKKEAVV